MTEQLAEEHRSAGYCVLCDRIVERAADDACPAGHPAEAVSGRLLLSPGEPVPALPRFNVAAFLMPPVWGPGHGQWAGAFFLPMWLFMDSVIASAMGRGTVMQVVAVCVVAVTVAAQAWFGKRANGLAWRRICDRVSPAEYARRERFWLAAMLPVALLVWGWGLYFRFVVQG